MTSDRTNSQPEFVRLLSRHSSHIYGFILMLSVSHSDADDVFQDTSVVLWEKFDSYELGTSFRAWACKIAYYEVLELRRKNNLMKYLSNNTLTLLAKDALTLMQQEDDRKDSLADCLGKLTAKDRQLIEQKYFVRLSTEEIADKSSKSTYSVYRALTRVHSNLSNCVKRHLRTSEGGAR